MINNNDTAVIETVPVTTPLDLNDYEVEEVYFAIPTAYSIGRRFETYDEAWAYAWGNGEGWVDERHVLVYRDGSGKSDRVIKRTEV